MYSAFDPAWDSTMLGVEVQRLGLGHVQAFSSPDGISKASIGKSVWGHSVGSQRADGE